jgi:hypothetical protein
MKTSPTTLSALPILMFAVAAFLIAPASRAQEEGAPNLNVIVNDGALDDLPAGGSEEPLLTPPDRRPVSRLLMLPSGRIVGAADVATSPETTVSAVPTTPIQSTDLGEPGTETPAPTQTATAPESSAETTAGELPDESDSQHLLEGQIRIPYEEESDIIPEAVKGKIVGLIEKMNADYSLHLQVLAYARGDDDEIGHARGVSLARAIGMRNFLVENGLDLTRMDVRALGNTAQEDPADRVDLIPLVQ